VRVLVDTSAWVDFLNDFPSPAADALAELLQGDDDVCTCGIVVAEVFQGLHRDQGRDSIRRSFEDMIFLEPPGIRLYLRAAGLYRALRERGTTVRSTVDCIIAALAEDSGCDLLARDRDMDAILDSGLLKAGRFQPPASRG
jgi:predicted nucleic acid-binding protein